MIRRITLALFGALALLACGGDAAPEAVGADAADSAGVALDSAGAALASRDARAGSGEARPRRVYYDLTRHEWYRRGEPLVAEGAAYEQAGDPIPLSGDSLRLAGSYQDVDYYARVDGGAGGVVFVPVFDRYWLPFARAGTQPGAGAAADSAAG